MFRLHFPNPDEDEVYFNYGLRPSMLGAPIQLREGIFYYPGSLSGFAHEEALRSHTVEKNNEKGERRSEETFDDLPESSVVRRPRRNTR